MTKKVLITGASGFLGKYLHRAYEREGWKVWTLGRSIASANHISVDFSSGSKLALPKVYFDHVVHAAGKAHTYPKSEEEENAFYEVNVAGTRQLLSALDENKNKPKVIIFISSVAVYGLDSGVGINEDVACMPTLAYGKSKLLAEQAIQEWSEDNGSAFYFLRPPLIAGEDAPGNLGSLTKAIRRGMYFSIKENPARKSIVLAEDISQFLPTLHGPSGAYNLTDGEEHSFTSIESAIATGLGRRIWIELPLPLIQLLGKTGDIINRCGFKFNINSVFINKMTSSLTFSDQKARNLLSWNSNSSLDFFKSSSTYD